MVGPMVLKMPLYVFDGINLDLYQSEDTLSDCLEEQDVEKDVYQCFDSEGYSIMLNVAKGSTDFVVKTVKGSLNIRGLIESLHRSLSAVGVSLNEELTLSDLQNLAKSTFDIY